MQKVKRVLKQKTPKPNRQQSATPNDTINLATPEMVFINTPDSELKIRKTSEDEPSTSKPSTSQGGSGKDFLALKQLEMMKTHLREKYCNDIDVLVTLVDILHFHNKSRQQRSLATALLTFEEEETMKRNRQSLTLKGQNCRLLSARPLRRCVKATKES